MRLWHDDVRPPPDDDDWVWAKTNDEAKTLLVYGGIEECSLDHDLGAVPTGETDPRDVLYLRGDSRAGSGLDLVRWMVEHDQVPNRVTIHSWNPPGALAMARELVSAGHDPIIRPYEVPA